LTTSKNGGGNSFALSLPLVAFGVVILLGWLFPELFQHWNDRFQDQCFRARTRFPQGTPGYLETVVHVDINDSAVQQLGSFYLDRSVYARVIHNLAAMEVARQAYDFIFAAPRSEPEDQSLIGATFDAGNVYFGMAFRFSDRKASEPGETGNDGPNLEYLKRTTWILETAGDASSFYQGTRPLMTFLPLAAAAQGLGSINVETDSDGLFRRLPLLIRTDHGFYPSLALRLACDTLKVVPEQVRVQPGRSITLGGARLDGGPPHDVVIPINDRGEMRVNFIGNWERMRHYNFAAIHDAAEDPEEMALWQEELRGKIVMVSDVSTASVDIGPVPTDVSFPLSGLHAMALHTILTEEFLREPSVLARTALLCMLAAAVFALARYAGGFAFPISMCLIIGGYAWFAVLAFVYGRVLVDVARPVAFGALSTLVVSGYRYFNGLKERAVLRRTLEAYFPPAVVRRVLANPGLLALGGQKKELTVLFSDIKEFTKHSSRLPAGYIQELLNEYFEDMVAIVFRHQGTVDKYIGDGLMVFFGDPEPQPDHALRGVRTAIEMQKKVSELRERWLEKGAFPLAIRIGINTGEVVVGNMGSSKRLAYTVIGSSVNLAQRLESNAPVGGILISPRTCELVRDHIRVTAREPLFVKGIDEPVEVYEVLMDQETS
jgi:adenylate cyclase